jgi:hypothetical protein
MVAEPWSGEVTAFTVVQEFNRTRMALVNLQGEFNQKLTKQGEAVGALFSSLQELKHDFAALNGKVDIIKVATDSNDDLVKQRIDAKVVELQAANDVMRVEFTQAHQFTHAAVGQLQTDLLAAFNRLDDMGKQFMNVQSHLTSGAGSGYASGFIQKNISEYRAITNIEKLGDSAQDFSIWSLRLKNNLKQINPAYLLLMELIEKLPSSIVTYGHWKVNYQEALQMHSNLDPAAFNKLSQDLYTVLVDKCSDSHVLSFENEDLDGFFAYSQIYRSITRTAGIGSLERREYLTNPQTAKKDSEIYDLIMTWERELSMQEKSTPPEYRPLLSPPMKTSVMKKIATGQIKEYIKTHEALKDYEELKGEVLQMALFSKAEVSKAAKGPGPMDLNAVLTKLKENLSLEPIKPETHVDLGGMPTKCNEVDQAVAELMALVKGKGKGRECFNCGKVGHLAANCWAPPKKGNYQKGFGKGEYGKAQPKGGGKGLCFNCGEPNHFARDCPKPRGYLKGKGKGINGVDGDSIKEGAAQDGAMQFGGGEPQFSYDHNYDAGAGFGSVDYDSQWKTITKGKPVREVYGITKEGNWEKITFTADSGAVDHVITKSDAKAFKLHESQMSKAGIGFSAANGTPISNYGSKHLNGITENNLKFNMQANVTDVNKNLASIPKILKEGSDVFLSIAKGSYIKNEKAGAQIPLRIKENGMPEFDLWVQRSNHLGQFGMLNVNGEADIKDSDLSSFQRLEKLV